MQKKDMENFVRSRFCIEIMSRNQERALIRICRKNGTPTVKRDKDTYKEGKSVYPIYYGFVLINGTLSGWCNISKENVEKSGFVIISFRDFQYW